jgi:replicative DNA helicase Mcm
MLIENIYEDLNSVTRKIQEDYASFIEDKYSEELEDLGKRDDFIIDLTELKVYNSELYEDIMNKPKKAIYDINKYIEEETGLEKNVKFENSPEEITVDQLTEYDLGDFVSVSGIIPSKTDVDPKSIELAFKCRCGHEEILRQVQYDTETPIYPECPNCGKSSPKKLIAKKDEFEVIDCQKIKLQETPEESKSSGKPMSRKVDVYGDLAGTIEPGERVTIHGILDARGSKTDSGRLKNTILNYFLNAISIEYEEQSFEDLEISREDEKRIIELSNDPDIYQKLSRSIAPSIRGDTIDKIKESIVFQLFSGVTKKTGDSRIRGDIHILIVGDPGTGKSQVLKFVGNNITPRGKYSSGKSTTAAGLTAAAVADGDFGNDTWTLEAGVLPKSDGGVACVDEFDKMSSNDRDSMHEALEQQTLSVNKAGISATMKTRTALLAAANPDKGRFDEYEKIAEQIDLEPAMFSRFDLVFTLQDIIDEQKDSEIASKIFENNRRGEIKASDSDEEVQEDDIINPELFKKYIAYSRNNCVPVMSKELEPDISNFYVDVRQDGKSEEGELDRYPITARKIGAMIRIAEASARIRLDDKVRKKDFERAKDILNFSLKQVATDPETGEMDIDVLQNETSKKERQDFKDLLGVVKHLIKEEGKDLSDVDNTDRNETVISEERLEEFAIEKLSDMTEQKLESNIQELKTSGSLFEPKNGYYALG